MSISLIRRTVLLSQLVIKPLRNTQGYPVTGSGLSPLWDGGYLDPTLSIDIKDCLARSGDAWPSILLQKKSTADLQRLWYVLLKEKNFLLSERNGFFQMGQDQKFHGRLKKVKLGMRRILRVITRREIHEQVMRGKDILSAQMTREQLETRRFQLEETIKELQYKLERLDTNESLKKTTWTRALSFALQERNKLLIELKPLRAVALQCVTPDWRYSKRFSDLPGNMSWEPMYIKALADKHRLRRKRF